MSLLIKGWYVIPKRCLNNLIPEKVKKFATTLWKRQHLWHHSRLELEGLSSRTITEDLKSFCLQAFFLLLWWQRSQLVITPLSRAFSKTALCAHCHIRTCAFSVAGWISRSLYTDRKTPGNEVTAATIHAITSYLIKRAHTHSRCTILSHYITAEAVKCSV